MLDESDPYDQRLQAKIKHSLLETYLDRLVNIVGVGQACNEFVYVDAFAGPWLSKTNDYSDTSFGVALRILEKAFLTVNAIRNFKIRAIFIEYDAKSFVELQAFTNAYAGQVKVECRNDKFQNCIPYLANQSGFCFYLIDPKGWKDIVEASVLRPLLINQNAELLVNVMWNFIKLALGHSKKIPEHAENLKKVFGSIDGLENVASKEETLMLRYRKMLAAEQAGNDGRKRIWTMSFPVSDPSKTTTKYHLVFTTHSSRGLIEFAEQSSKTDKLQRQVVSTNRVNMKNQRHRTEDMFGGSSQTPKDADQIDRMKTVWLELLPAVGVKVEVNELVFARLVEANDCYPNELQSALKELVLAGVIVNPAAKKTRTVNVVNWKENEVLERMR